MPWDAKKYYQTKGKEKAKERYQKNRDAILEKAREDRKDVVKRRKLQFAVLRSRAKKNGVRFSLDFLDIVWPEVCPILEIPLTYEGDSWDSPSFDKIVPEMGYIKGNVRIISNLANTMKAHANKQQLLVFARNIGKYLG